jgi:ATP adenylyltransferase
LPKQKKNRKKKNNRAMDKLWAPWRLEYIVNADADVDCIFCSKPKEDKDEENLICFRSEHSFVMLNKYPYNNGHLMVVPYLHESDLTRLTDTVILDLSHTLNKAILAIRHAMHPHGMNIGVNLGRTAGAGIDEHLHYHVVPRWNGDTNFMPVLTDVKVVSESLQSSWRKLTTAFRKIEAYK